MSKLAEVKELTERVNVLTRTVSDKEAEVGQLKQQASTIQQDSQILASFPKNRAETLKDSEYLTLIKSSLVIKTQDGKTIIEKNGQELRDKLGNPVPIVQAIGDIFTERKWVAEESGGGGGRGAGDSNGKTGTFSKRSEVIAHYEKQGKSINGEFGQEITAKLAELKKADAEFDMNS